MTITIGKTVVNLVCLFTEWIIYITKVDNGITINFVINIFEREEKFLFTMSIN